MPEAVDDELVFHEDLHNWVHGDQPNLLDNDLYAGGAFHVVTDDVVSDAGAEVSLRTDGTFFYDGDGSVVTDSFEYRIEGTALDAPQSQWATVTLTIEPMTHDVEDLREAGHTDAVEVEIGTDGLHSIGDVDGDGYGELAVRHSDGLSSHFDVMRGVAGALPPWPDVEAGDAGWRIDNASDCVAAGNFNGDAYADVLVRNGDQAFVLFGRPDPQDFDAATTAEVAGVRIIPPEGIVGFGAMVGLGDFDGDGLDDVALADWSVAGPEDGEGAVFVVFGRSEPGLVTAPELQAGIGGIAIMTAPGVTGFGNRVAQGQDVNADGLQDLLIYAVVHPGSDAAWVVFGTQDPQPMGIDALGPGGFAISVSPDPQQGEVDARTMAGIGDFDGDGLGDIVMADSYFEAGEAEENVGRVYFVRGKADAEPVALADVAAGEGGWVLDGRSGVAPGLSDNLPGRLGNVLAAFGDADGDGLSDFLVGAPWTRRANPHDHGVGRVWIVYGRRGAAAPELWPLSRGEGGYVVVGGHGDEQFGQHAVCLPRPGGCDLAVAVERLLEPTRLEIVRTAAL